MTPEDAEASVVQLEQALGWHLANMPIAIRDQWTTRVRTTLVDMNVDVDDQAQLRAAFAGAYMMANLLMPASQIPIMHAGAAVGILRNLLDRSVATEPAGDLEALLDEPNVEEPPRRRWWLW